MATEKKKGDGPKERRYVVDLEDTGGGTARIAGYALGALGGLALAALLVRTLRGRGGEDGGALVELAPARRARRGARGTDELTELEDRVLDAFLADEVLSAEAIDVGAVAPGIVELSGLVSGRAELRRALGAAQRISGVTTVLNRMEVEEDRARHALDPEDGDRPGAGYEWTGLRSGMGTRRQGRETDPDRPDDSHHQREVALERADRAQWEEEGYHHRPRMAARGDEPREPAGFAEGDLDNQSPYGKHATPAPPPREPRNSGARVGEGLKPGTELRLEGSDVPVKPHQRARGDGHRGV